MMVLESVVGNYFLVLVFRCIFSLFLGQGPIVL